MTLKELTLKDLMRIAYNAGLDDQDNSEGFHYWWAKFGEERRDAFVELVSGDDRFLFKEDS